MRFYYKRSTEFETLDFTETILFFEKVTQCYLEQILTLADSNTNVTGINHKNISKLVSLAKMIKRNYEMDKIQSEQDDGAVLQSWISLGAVLEGCLQSFLKIYQSSYDNQPVLDHKSKKISIEKLKSYQLIEYFFSGAGIIQNGEFKKSNIDNIRIQRNLVHFFAGDEINNWDTLNKSVKLVIEILFDLISRLPELEDEYGYVSLCDEELLREINCKKYRWFIFQETGR